ncbi:hypothetical protein [Segetibacter sp.]|jgi:hypothetical protein|uniref:hypothetical protein n=1 Tax=Segetibacter sp. TaxID=2231182 RepID=UPI00261274B5|nr:hypothetical protein [Segetibacter sp.]MCW3081998.1 hypothetical protein [Segetibacter sp.]
MRKVLFSIILITTLISCQKNDKGADPVQDALLSLQGKYLICDSVKTTVNGTTKKQVLGKGKGWDRTFGIYANLEIHSSPVVYKSYSYEGPNKIYYWNTSGPYSTEQYYTIVSASNTNLVLLETEKGTGKVFTEYFTAE